MADERYEWLDKDAAERLLRGEPVGPLGEHARAEAERLTAALDGVARAGGHEARELPGEAAALAAFRTARAASPEGFSTIRIGRRAAVPVRWARPVRIGLAGALAGVALGGVAVAAGTGVLPSPFGRDSGPAPASTVSAAATPPPVNPGTTTAAPGEPGGPTPETTGTPDGDHRGPGSGDGSGEGAGAGTHESSPGSGTGVLPTLPGRTGDDVPGTDDGAGEAADSRDWYRKTAKACQDYRSGDLAPDRERRLEAAAKGADRVERFCDRLLDGDGSGDGSGGSDDGAGDPGAGRTGGDAGGEGRDDGRGDADKNGGSDGTDGSQGAPEGVHRRMPSIAYTPPSTPTTVEPSAAPVGASSQQG
ncbi:hypothetical protein AS594_13605 [Streptomyces agglomeratus]|uniref:Extensin n=1 Tax=Streptomyces agglomeratus TaxID=285458 RepID=A0A1E5P764_9ACTN|nr:hypothetical protein [Streptomyces agglomeratus]OEJ25370.1 hypothetical protein AS594_13605 [Streptomyces agglomeratus]OEJ53142.1 hypothetical protein BGK72_22500 [Streptomyces agglomeratus]